MDELLLGGPNPDLESASDSELEVGSSSGKCMTLAGVLGSEASAADSRNGSSALGSASEVDDGNDSMGSISGRGTVTFGLSRELLVLRSSIGTAVDREGIGGVWNREVDVED